MYGAAGFPAHLVWPSEKAQIQYLPCTAPNRAKQCEKRLAVRAHRRVGLAGVHKVKSLVRGNPGRESNVAELSVLVLHCDKARHRRGAAFRLSPS